jgi:hypothetical protein
VSLYLDVPQCNVHLPCSSSRRRWFHKLVELLETYVLKGTCYIIQHSMVPSSLAAVVVTLLWELGGLHVAAASLPLGVLGKLC